MGPIGIELTNVCNFNCHHCYVDKGKSTVATLSFKQYTKILDFFISTDSINLFLTGGEPFMLNRFDEFYSYAIDKGFLTTIFTNGFILTDKIKLALTQKKPFAMEVSIYGMTDEIYSYITRVGTNCDVIFNNVNWFLKQGIDVELKYVAMKHNLHQLDKFIEYVKKNSIKHSINPALFPLLNEKHLETNFRLSSSELDVIIKKYPQKIKVDALQSQIRCDAGDLLYITSSGNLKGCPVLTREYSINWDVMTTYALEEIVDDIKLNINNKSYKYCPAWEELENKTKISSILKVKL
ncbi:radical SAM protein [Proteiniborus sp. MB09-C3]|uniref:radical SAM protein n=1 Tax=Proteiniborus sp. MB09-C3 TaxID=3050072 RepID=UPI0025576E1B|nr:radical SAM protein [Proteiniborus sp. MB09-C3]WIV11351.1 radical SAM protein [Proteiniborus sp. MB09-C3]